MERHGDHGEGDRFIVTFNAIRTVDGVRNADFADGRIAPQYGLGLVKFRKVQVRTIQVCDRPPPP